MRVANLANFLTGIRLVLVPIFLLFLFAGDGHETASRLTAFIIFAVAVITDRLDGSLARTYGMVTEFGKLADPIADKMLIGAALIGLSMLGDLPWWVTVVILIRELGITVLRFAVLRRGVIPRQPRRQGQDAGAGRRDRAVRAAVAQLATGLAHRGLGDHVGGDRVDRDHRGGRLRGLGDQGLP